MTLFIPCMQICDERTALREMLERYMNAYPAFRMKPIGAPGSQARDEQERLMALEDSARALLTPSPTYGSER